MNTSIFIVGRTFFYNKTQDAATSKTILDVRPRSDYDLTHVRASFSTPIVEEFKVMIGSDEELIVSSLEKLTNLLKSTRDEITVQLNDLYGKVSGFKLRGIGYKTVLLYGEEDIVLSELKTCTQKVENDIKFPNCDRLLEPIHRLVGDVDTSDSAKHTVLLLAELLKKEALVENIYVLNSYRSYMEKYSFVLTFKDKFGHQSLYPSEIIEDFLYLGDRNNASSDKELSDIGITYILNMAEEVENVLEEMILDNGERKYRYMKLGTGDTIEHTISDLFNQANEFLREAHEKNCKAIVNCNMGISRSTTTVLSYLMKYYELEFEDAFHHAKGQRSIVNPNQAFRVQLKTFYKTD